MHVNCAHEATRIRMRTQSKERRRESPAIVLIMSCIVCHVYEPPTTQTCARTVATRFTQLARWRCLRRGSSGALVAPIRSLWRRRSQRCANTSRLASALPIGSERRQHLSYVELGLARRGSRPATPNATRAADIICCGPLGASINHNLFSIERGDCERRLRRIVGQYRRSALCVCVWRQARSPAIAASISPVVWRRRRAPAARLAAPPAAGRDERLVVCLCMHWSQRRCTRSCEGAMTLN